MFISLSLKSLNKLRVRDQDTCVGDHQAEPHAFKLFVARVGRQEQVHYATQEHHDDLTNEHVGGILHFESLLGPLMSHLRCLGMPAAVGDKLAESFSILCWLVDLFDLLDPKYGASVVHCWLKDLEYSVNLGLEAGLKPVLVAVLVLPD